MRGHTRMVGICGLRGVLRISVLRRIVRRSLRMVGWRADLPLPTLFLNGYLGIDLPVKALPFLVSLHKRIMLAKIVANARLPSASRCLELVPGIFLLDVVVNLLQVHLAGAGR